MDLGIRSGSRISRLPKLIRPLAVLGRQVREALRVTSYSIGSDGIKTVYNPQLMIDPTFIREHASVVKAAGWDHESPIVFTRYCGARDQHLPACSYRRHRTRLSYVRGSAGSARSHRPPVIKHKRELQPERGGDRLGAWTIPTCSGKAPAHARSWRPGSKINPERAWHSRCP
jgi:hypothetical protein